MMPTAPMRLCPMRPSGCAACSRRISGAFLATPSLDGAVPALMRNLLEWLRPAGGRPRTAASPLFALAAVARDDSGASAALADLERAVARGFGATLVGGGLAPAAPNSPSTRAAGLDDANQAAALQVLARELVHARRRLVPEPRRSPHLSATEDATASMPLLDLRDRLIVGLDLPTVAAAEAMVETLGDDVTFYKVGLQLTFAGGLDFALGGWSTAARRCFSTSSCSTSTTPCNTRSRTSPRSASPSAPCMPIRRRCAPPSPAAARRRFACSP